MAATTNGHSSNGTATNGIAPRITLYTNHRCPWAHRAHIALKELNLPYEEVIIDLGKPREPWYLEVNPRGLVPTIKYSNGAIDATITESAIVAQFLADSFPSHLVPASNSSPEAPLVRARISFFVDAFFSKVNSKVNEAMKAEGAEQEAKTAEVIAAITKEIEPLLADAAPFFAGSSKFTMAEVLTAPFVIRLHSYGRHGVLPASLTKDLQTLPNYSKWADLVTKAESVTYIFDEVEVAKGTKQRMEKLRAAAK